MQTLLYNILGYEITIINITMNYIYLQTALLHLHCQADMNQKSR